MGENPVSVMRAPRRAKATLNRLLGSRQISPGGVKWLEIATDPFHDTEVVSDGYPDMVTTRSIVQTVTKTFSVVKPSATTWDCHVFFSPLSPVFRQGTTLTTTTTTSTTQNSSITTTASVEDTNYDLEYRPMERQHGKMCMKVDSSGNKLFLRGRMWVTKEKMLDTIRRFLEEKTQEKERLANEMRHELTSLDEIELEIISQGPKLQEPREEKGKKLPGSGTVTLDGYYRTTITASGLVNQAGSGNILHTGWNVLSIPNGDDWQTDAAVSYTEGNFPRNYGAGTYRLIATGVEVVNTTAALYKGGAVTCYRSPCPKSQISLRAANVGNEVEKMTYFSAPVGVLPPSTQENASLYPNSRTWGAEDGVYLVGAMNSTEIPYFTPSPGISGLISPTSVTQMESGSGWIGYMPRILVGDVTTNADLSAASTIWPWDISGCIFSGLNENSTLQVTVRYYIERHPSIAEPDLLVLSRTPCPYDPIIQEIYARSMHELPVGVPVGENPLGEWFNEVLDAVSTWAPKFGQAVGNIVPGAGLVGQAVGLGAQHWLKSRKNNKGGALPAPKPPKGGTLSQKVKMDKKGKVKEIDTVVKSKKKKYTAAEKRAYQMRIASKNVQKNRPKGPKRRPPTRKNK